MSKTWNEEELQQVSAAMKKRGLPTFEEFCKEMPIKESANRLYDVIYFDEESGDIEVKMSGYPLEECQNELRQMAVNMMVECGAHVVDALYLYTSGGGSAANRDNIPVGPRRRRRRAVGVPLLKGHE